MLKKAGKWLWRKKWWFLAFIVVVIGGLGYWQKQQNKSEPYTLIQPEVRDITQVLTVSGAVDAKEKAQLHFPASSKLTWMGVQEGDSVKKWQGIAKVDTVTLQKQMQIDQNLHGKQFRTFENTLDTNDYYSDSGLTETERRAVESAQLDLRNTALAVEIRDIAIKYSTLTSPLNGLVTRIDQPNVGSLVLPTDIYEVINPKSVYFTVTVDEADIRLVNASQAAKITLDAYPEEKLDAQVTEIAFKPSASEGGGTGYVAKLTLPVNNNDLKYRLGMNGEADIVLSQRQGVLTIPFDTLIEREGQKYVEVWRDNDREQIEVETGIDDGEHVEIISGVTAQDLVVMPTE